MGRVVLLMIPVLFFVAVIATLRACHLSAERATTQQSAPATLVALDDNSVLLATDGSITQELVAWMKSPGPSRRRFEVGGRLFAPGAATPLASASNRVVRLVEMLHAYPAVTLRVMGETQPSGMPERDQRLSDQRAAASLDLLVKFGADRK